MSNGISGPNIVSAFPRSVRLDKQATYQCLDFICDGLRVSVFNTFIPTLWRDICAALAGENEQMEWQLAERYADEHAGEIITHEGRNTP